MLVHWRLGYGVAERSPRELRRGQRVTDLPGEQLISDLVEVPSNPERKETQRAVEFAYHLMKVDHPRSLMPQRLEKSVAVHVGLIRGLVVVAAKPREVNEVDLAAPPGHGQRSLSESSRMAGGRAEHQPGEGA